MENNGRKAIKSGVWYTVANFIMKSMAFITTPLFTRLLSTRDYGLYNNFTAWMNTLMVLITLNLDATFISARFDYEDTFDEYIFSVLSLSTLSGAVWLLLVNLFSGQAAALTGIRPLFLNLMVLYLLLLPAVNMFQGRERYAYRYKTSVALSLGISVATTLLSVLLVICMKDSQLTGRILGTVLPTILIGAVLYGVIAKNGRRIRVHYWKYALPICIPFIPHLLSLTLLNMMDRIMIMRICGAEDNALYSVAYTCGAILTLLVTSMNTAFSPWLGEKLHAHADAEIHRASKRYIALFAALSAGVMLITPEILMVMGGRKYMSAIYVMPPVAFGCVCQFLYTMFVNVEQFQRKTVGMAFASMSAALVNLVLNAIFIPKFGYIAAAYTTLAGFLWLLFVHMILVKRLGYLQVYPVRFILLVLVAMSVYTVAVNYLYMLPVIRYSLILIYGAAVIWFGIRYRSMILVLFKRS